MAQQYFVTSDLDTYFVDKDSGLPLAAGTLTFYRDSARSTPKTVYQLTGAPPNYTFTALPNPINLSSVGTVQDAGGDNVVIYYFPYDEDGNIDLYYVVVADSNSVVQCTREAWPPNATSGNNPVTSSFTTENQISNSQFTQSFLNENAATVYSVSGATNQVFEFAPNWDFVISGTGSVTVQRIAIAGNQNVVTSPPYVLDVTVSAGITGCNLRQRFNINSGLWASTAIQSIFLSGTLIARNEVAGSTGIEMFYAESSGGSPINILSESFDNSGYQVLMGFTAAEIPLSSDTNTDSEGYVDIYLSFLTGSHVQISSIQVVPTTNPSGGVNIEYDLNSSNREQALMGDYYIPRLNARPAASLLTAWDFVLNPFQFKASGNITTTPAYICDQTIALCGSTGNIGFDINPVTLALRLITAGNNDAFYLMQYLSANDARKILGTPLSVNVFGYVTSMSGNVTMNVHLFRAPDTSSIPTLPTSIGTLASNGAFTLTASGWTEIPRGGLPTASAILPTVPTNPDLNNLDNDIGFTGWEITDNVQISDTVYFAIVVTFAYIDTGTTIDIHSISLIPSDIPARPAPKSFDEVVRQCQYYYEKSSDLTGYPALGVLNGARMIQMVATLAGSYGAVPLSFCVSYETRKRTPVSGFPVTPTIYSTDGTINNVFVEVFHNTTLANSGNAAITNWSATVSGQTNFLFRPVDLSVALIGPNANPYQPNAEAFILFQFIADARLGIV